jgi:hypothetical protein
MVVNGCVCVPPGEYERIGTDGSGEAMAKQTSDNLLDLRLESLFPAYEGLPCPAGSDLLCVFAAVCDADFSLLKPDDLVGLRNYAFAGISEWEAFEHDGSCELWNA